MTALLTSTTDHDSFWTASTVGGKALALWRLRSAGVLVPFGVALSVGLLRDYLSTDLLLEMKAAIAGLTDMGAIVESCRMYRQEIETRPIPDKLRSRIDEAVGSLRGQRFAVRSSAVQEDGLLRSWAGQFDSFLDVSAEDVGSKVVSCWASTVSPRSVFYCKAFGVKLTELGMAVLVQELVPATVSGVAFTKHPTENDLSIIYVEAVTGSGEALVAGAVIPQRFVIRKRDGRILSATTSESPAGRGSSRSSGGGRSGPVLSASNVEALVKICRTAEDLFGVPQDVEFAVWRGHVYALQARPITN
jgi:pyruvate,water dikinase